VGLVLTLNGVAGFVQLLYFYVVLDVLKGKYFYPNMVQLGLAIISLSFIFTMIYQRYFTNINQRVKKSMMFFRSTSLNV
jgi:hypothetical protein